MTNRDQDARWLCSYLAGASKGADPKLVDVWLASNNKRAGLLQELLDTGAVEIGVKGRYWLTTKGQALAVGWRE